MVKIDCDFNNDHDWYLFIMHLDIVLTAPIFLFALFCLLFRSPKAMSNHRWHLLNNVVWWEAAFNNFMINFRAKRNSMPMTKIAIPQVLLPLSLKLRVRQDRAESLESARANISRPSQFSFLLGKLGKKPNCSFVPGLIGSISAVGIKIRYLFTVIAFKTISLTS